MGTQVPGHNNQENTVTEQSLLQFVRSRGNCSLEEVAKHLKVSTATAHKRVKQLRAEKHLAPASPNEARAIRIYHVPTSL